MVAFRWFVLTGFWVSAVLFVVLMALMTANMARVAFG